MFLIIDREPYSDEDRRAVFVGLTRAKSSLWIGYNGEYFQEFVSDLGRHVVDAREFPDPPKISLTLGLSHVYLGKFVRYQEDIGRLLPGDELRFGSSGLVTWNGKEVLRFSNAFKERLARYGARHFVVETARVNYVVYWWDKEQGKEVRVVLPEVVMGRGSFRVGL